LSPTPIWRGERPLRAAAQQQNAATLTGSIGFSVESAFLQLTGREYLLYANFDTACPGAERIVPYISPGNG